MLRLLTASLQQRRLLHLSNAISLIRLAHYKPQKAAAPPPAPPTPPKPPQKPVTFTVHDDTWQDPYSWMSNLGDKVAMRHMDVCMEQEEKYTEAVMSDTDRLQRKLQSEMASRMASHLSTPPVRWGPWLYYRRVEEGKQYPVLCRRSVSLNEEFISYNSPSAGFDFTSGKRIEQKLIDYNLEAERFGGYAYEELSEVSPDHRFLAYTMYDKDNDYFRLSVRDLTSGSLCSKPQADRVANLAWAKDGQALLYTVTDSNKRPYRIFCSMLGSSEEDVLLAEESDETVYVNIGHTKDFQFVTVNTFSNSFSKVYLINANDPLSGMTLAWECEVQAHCIVEHHQGYLYLFTDAAKEGQPVDSHYLLRCPVQASSGSRNWEGVFIDDPDFIIEDADFSNTHLILTLREGRNLRICSVDLPLPGGNGPVLLKELNPRFLPLPEYVSQISSGPNYDYYSSTMRFTISSPVMPDAVVEYNLSNGKWLIVQQQNVLHERTRTLYGTVSSTSSMDKSPSSRSYGSANKVNCEDDHLWNDLSEFYACEQYDVSSHDGVFVPLTIVYSRQNKQEGKSPGLLHGHGAYGELLDKRWRSELKSLLDRGWVVAYADVRGGGGGGKKWHHDGRRTKKHNSIEDYICCARFLIEKEIVQENKLAGWGYSAGGLLVASAINYCPDLFHAAVLKVPFLDASNTLLYPILPLTPVEYEEFGYPGDIEDFQAIRKYSPYDNIQKDVLYPATMQTHPKRRRFAIWLVLIRILRVRSFRLLGEKHGIIYTFVFDRLEYNKVLSSVSKAIISDSSHLHCFN
ncbi:hypothetical protein HHK36_010018 [Tetracentron sinense]|uniref:Prolyl endopeptidase n=1 Tax=Tetracentron sinense TaxID=13715 RepID=A0A834ZG69_TETSI|nr:hypothetical protein HHK36_010018 [Tetracentron sinense]